MLIKGYVGIAGTSWVVFLNLQGVYHLYSTKPGLRKSIPNTGGYFLSNEFEEFFHIFSPESPFLSFLGQCRYCRKIRCSFSEP
jgi:hypothetical protein